MFNRLLNETTPEGAVDYTYDADGRRASMTVAGQATVTYTYDNAHRLTSISRGFATATFAHDDAGRRTSLTYPNGIVAGYTYDDANRLLCISYVLGSTTLASTRCSRGPTAEGPAPCWRMRSARRSR